MLMCTSLPALFQPSPQTLLSSNLHLFTFLELIFRFRIPYNNHPQLADNHFLTKPRPRVRDRQLVQVLEQRGNLEPYSHETNSRLCAIVGTCLRIPYQRMQIGGFGFNFLSSVTPLASRLSPASAASFLPSFTFQPQATKGQDAFTVHGTDPGITTCFALTACIEAQS